MSMGSAPQGGSAGGRGRRRGGGKRAPMSEINVTPMVDVMLVLLIIFLITIPVVVQTVQVKLPSETNIARQTKPENIEIAVNKDGDVFWNAQPVADDATALALLSDAELRPGLAAAMAARPMPAEGLWVFGYGSLMWDPAIHFTELRRAELPGHGRRFCYRTLMGRGTPDRPALMLSLEAAAGNNCHGLVFCVQASQVHDESSALWRREMVRGGYLPTLLDVHTPQGPVQALVFLSNPDHPGHCGEMPLDESAAIIASAPATCEGCAMSRP